MKNKSKPQWIAILLAAGSGLRLLPLTKTIPKPLTIVNGAPLIDHAIAHLTKNNIHKFIVVVGYKASEIKRHIARKHKGIDVTYIHNPAYAATNNIYSLWLAKKYLKKHNTVLVETDVIFDERIFALVDFSPKRSWWFADRFTQQMNGALLVADKAGKIKSIHIVREKLPLYKNNFFKSIGILLINRQLGNALSRWMDKEIRQGNRRIYYDLVFAKHVAAANLYVKYVGRLRWWEIDDLADLAYAKKIFK